MATAASTRYRAPLNGCPKQPDVAAFVLGALTPAEERATMAHVAGCGICQATLQEFATLPDLLALVPRSVIELIDRSRTTPPVPR